MDEDLVLMRRVAAGDRQAFEILYRRYAPRLAGYLTKLLHQRELVEEVLDDVMLVVWQNAARFDPTVRFSTWLFGIAHHKAMKAWGHAANKPLPLPPLRHDVESDQENPEQILTDQERDRTFVQALESLSPEQRAVVELTFYHACSYQEIAAITGCPVNTVKTRMFHARRRLAQYLEALGLRHTSGRQETSA
jgi:RNA polymerase sigma-70 factor (ECF subfamily)